MKLRICFRKWGLAEKGKRGSRIARGKHRLNKTAWKSSALWGCLGQWNWFWPELPFSQMESNGQPRITRCKFAFIWWFFLPVWCFPGCTFYKHWLYKWKRKKLLYILYIMTVLPWLWILKNTQTALELHHNLFTNSWKSICILFQKHQMHRKPYRSVLLYIYSTKNVSCLEGKKNH